MQNPRIYISTATFAKENKSPLEMLLKKGWEVKINHTSRTLQTEELLREAKEADAVIAGTENYKSVVERLPNLKFISRTGIGLDSVPLALCKKLGIRVHYTPDAVTDAVSEIVLGTMIALSRKIIDSNRDIRQGGWKRYIGPSLQESTIGIVGFGRIGKSLTRFLTGFGPAKILIHDERDIREEIQQTTEKTGLNLEFAELDELLKQSDFVTLHVPKKKNTIDLIGKRELALMKKEAFLINFSRGLIVNERDLHSTLSKHEIKGAALDVFSEEPYEGPLTDLPNLILTAHMGSCSKESRLKMDTQAAQAVVNFFEENPLENEVDYDQENF